MRRWIIPVVFAVFALPAIACGAGTPTPKVTSGGAATTAPAPATQAKASRAPDVAVGRVGDTVTLANYSVTLHAKQDPATGSFPAPSGQRFVAYDVTITALVDDVAYNLFYGHLKMADNTEATATVGGPSPALQSGKLAKGEAARGWLAFAIAVTAQPVTLSYEILTFGPTGGKAVFDVR